MEETYWKGRGAQINPPNPFSKNEYTQAHTEGVDEAWLTSAPETRLYFEQPKKIISQNNSPDLPWHASVNPYQGCEHGCVYCYARNAHEYWGFSAGLDFEHKLIVKKNAPQLLEKQFLQKNWKPQTIMLSGNTDCYQPIEKDLKITRELLKIFAKYRNPVSIYTKNSLILRDVDILQDLAKDQLLHVYMTITTLDEKLRRALEPRTTTALKKLETIEQLAEAKIPVGVMVAPLIPGLNHQEAMPIIREAAQRGACEAKYTVVRLNGSIADIFKDWLEKNFPDRSQKVWKQIQSLHGGEVNDQQWGRRMVGQGVLADSMAQMVQVAKNKYLSGKSMPAYDFSKFRRGGNLSLF